MKSASLTVSTATDIFGSNGFPAALSQQPSISNLADFESAMQSVSLEPAAWANNDGSSAIGQLAVQQQNLLSQAYDMTGLNLDGKSSNEMTLIMANKQLEILRAKTALDVSWAGVKEVRKGVEAVMNSK